MGFKKLALGLGAGLVLSMAVGGSASAQVIGVSWSNFQEERWKTDEAAMKAAIEAAGGTYISADAQSSNEKQIAECAKARCKRRLRQTSRQVILLLLAVPMR